jgi:CheY-like chemotaxis protein/HPt (histidine-containing phosphotransfer) domain-containing protein
MALEHVEFKPRDLVEEVAQLLRVSAERKGLALVCRVAPDVPDTLRGAPSRLRQVLINLVGNAIKFTDRGRVEIAVSTLTDAAAEAPGTGLRFAVEDTGIGIADPVQQRLFRAFEQADSSTTRSYGGTGLGLAISRELVERMGGRIGVRSTLGHGSEFWFTVPLDFPVTTRLSDARVASEGTEASRLTGIRVLLAEDNPINQDVAAAMLESLGCRVHVVDTGTKALDALNASAFDMVLMDRQMPELDGFDTTAAIRARGLRLPIVGLTASALKGDREMCLAAGMDDYLAKPFRRDDLRAVLERWVLDVRKRPADPEPSDAAARETFDRAALDQMLLNQRPAAARIVAGVIEQYFVDAPKLIATLDSACDRADAGALAHAAHLLGVGSDFVGARRLAALCGDLERAARASEARDWKPRIDGIRREYEAVHVAMQALRP